ncbi:MAG: leucine-rich repeat protein, partial [Clostridia bacterium]|nr:leucine-rich repeat protein [Clostridia bacterium]
SLTAVTVPFIGLTTTAQNEEARLSYVFGNTIVRIASVTVRNTQTDIAVNADAFQGMTALASLTLSDGVTTIAEGALADCPIQSLDLIFVGATAAATGANAVLGYLFGFAAVPDAFTIQQDINETESVYAYIPATLTDVTVQNAPDYGAFSNITSLQSVTVRGGDTLGKNLIAGCTALETLTVPFAGASADATGANSALTYITGSALPALTTLKITATSVLTAETLPLGFPIQTLEIGGNLSSLPQGLLANCPNLVHLMIPFAGASSTATGQDALFGYLYGFAATSTTTTVEQYYGEEASEVAYSEIPASLTSIVLTDNSDIGYGAFYNMSELRNLTLNAEVSIGQKAFYNCVRLQSISIGGNAKIMSVGAYAFYGAAFESVTISADVETIGAYAFAGCDNLVSVSFETGSHLKYVHEYAFANCTALQNIALPDGTQSVGANAFDHCSALSSAVIPSTVTEMGAALFKDCPNLVSLSLPFAGPDDTAVTAQHKLGYLFDESSSNVNVPLSLQTLHITDASFLADGALQDTHLTALFLNEGLLIIEESAVRNVPLQSITIPSTVLVVNKYAFANTAIQSLSFAANSVLHTLGDNAFDGCVSLGDVVLPDSVTSIGSAVFAGCLLNIRFSVPFIGATRAATGANAVLGYFFGTSGSGVTQKYAVDQTGIFAIPASLMNIMVTSATSIGYGAFSGCGAIRNISINNGVNTIGALALEGCISLESLILPFVGESANSVDTKARMQHVFGLGVNSGIHHVETVSITSAITIASGAFHGMTGLKTVSINNVTSIAQGVFEGCMALEDLTVPFIGAQSFHNNNDMLLLGYWFKSVAPSASGAVGQPYGDGPTEIAYAEIPTGIHRITVTHASKIGYGALSYLTELTSVSMNNGVSEIGKNALKGSYNIESLTVPFIGLSRNATSNAAKITYMFGSSPSNLTVVNVTDAIRLSTLAFASNTKITTITLDGNITSIDNNAFSGLTALTQITIPASVTTIGESAFEGCTSLVSVTFAQDTALTVIGEDAFKNTAILSLTIPSTVTSIGEGILEGCNNLETLTIPYIGASADATEQEALLGYVFGLSQTSSMQTTTQIYNDNNDAVYTVFPDNLYQLTVTSATEIGYGALHNCSSITELSLNSGITDIGRYAFSNCVNLTSIVVPDSVNTIGSAAFSGCASLESMTLPFAGTNRTDTGAIALFGYIFGTVSNGSPGATVQYFNAVSSRTYYIPSTLNTIVITSAAKLDYGVFYNLSGVTSITLNEGISAIPAKAFYQCSSVVSLVIPDTVTSIEGGALEGMNSLVSLTVPFVGASAAATGVQSQFGYIFGEAQEYGPNVMKQSIFIGDTEVNTLFRIPFALRDVTLTGITAIKDYAFYNCSNIATVSVTEGITAIGDYAFANASSLSAIYADFAALITIGDSAFENCRSFLGIDLSQASLLEQLGTRAFWGCSSLSYVNLPAGLNNVPLDAFGGI